MSVVVWHRPEPGDKVARLELSVPAEGVESTAAAVFALLRAIGVGWSPLEIVRMLSGPAPVERP